MGSSLSLSPENKTRTSPEITMAIYTEKPMQSILIKPTGPDCNMECTYCFYLPKKNIFPSSTAPRMTESTAKNLIQQVMKAADSMVSFNWQGAGKSRLVTVYKPMACCWTENGHASWPKMNFWWVCPWTDPSMSMTSTAGRRRAAAPGRVW